MIHEYTIQTAGAFDRIDDALLGKTDDDLSELMEDLEHLLYRAREIYNTAAAFSDGSDYNPVDQCDLPKSY
jgi:hypothetical protein